MGTASRTSFMQLPLWSTKEPWLVTDFNEALKKIEDDSSQRGINIRWYAHLVQNGNWSPAFQRAVDDITSSSNIQNSKGNGIYLPPNITYYLDSQVNISKSNIKIFGSSMRASLIVPRMNDGISSAFNFDTGNGVKLTDIVLENIMIDGAYRNVLGISMVNVMLARMKNVFIDKCSNNGIYFNESFDIVMDACVFRDSGDYTKNTHAVYAYNGLRDNCNRLLFSNCHFESNRGCHYYSDSTGNPRENGQNQFIGCKFHGPDPGNLPGFNPPVPNLYIHGSGHYIEHCMFFQSVDHFIVIKGNKNTITDCNMYNGLKSFVSVESGKYNKIDLTGEVYGYVNGYNSVEIAPESRDTIYVNVRTHNESRRTVYGSVNGLDIIGDDGGRFALWKNMYRKGNVKKQINGSMPSYGLALSANAEGINGYGAPATGQDESDIIPKDLFRATVDSFKTYVPINFVNVTSDAVPNNSLYTEAGKLKFKNSQGVVKEISFL